MDLDDKGNASVSKNVRSEGKTDFPDISNMTDDEILNLAPPDDDFKIVEEDEAIRIPSDREERAAELEDEDDQSESKVDFDDDPDPDENDSDDDTSDEETDDIDDDAEGSDAETPENEEKEDTSDDIASDENEADKADDSDQSGKKVDESENTDKNDDKDETLEKSPNSRGDIEKLFKPFKAAGTEHTIDNVDDLLTLAKKGIDYTKKMADIKPVLRTKRILDNNKIDEEALNHLIDIHNRVPGAIQKLIKDTDTNVLDIDNENGEEYKATAHHASVTDKQLDLEQTLQTIESSNSEHYVPLTQRLREFDQASRSAIVNDSSIINTLHEHMELGIYSRIQGKLETERALGNIPSSLSDLEAYKLVGDRIHEAGGFKDLQHQQAPKPDKPTLSDLTAKAKVEDPKIAKRRKAAAGSPRSTKAKAKPVVNVLDQSDEAFMKEYGNI